MYRVPTSYVVERDGNIVRVDLSDPPAPKFPGAGAQHEAPMAQAKQLLALRHAARVWSSRYLSCQLSMSRTGGSCSGSSRRRF